MKYITKRQISISLMVLISLLILSSNGFSQTRQRKIKNCQPTYSSNYQDRDNDRNRDYDRDRDNDRNRDYRYDNEDSRYDRNRDSRNYDYDREYENRPSRTKHIVVGTAIGAVGGAVIGGKKGALIGAGAGAGLGYIIHRRKDHR